VIFDTDFAIPPQDDGMALILALHSPEIDVLGITTVAGNYSVERATSDVLRLLEIDQRTDIPVYRGANMPLVHEKSDYATRVWGEWWSDDPPPPPPGGFATKQVVIMGGAIAGLADGHGNVTPNAEFNFWVDPEAARVVLRSGIPIVLSPLNVSRKTGLTKEWYERMVATDTPVTRLIRATMGPQFDRAPDASQLMYDQVAVASLIDPSLVTTRELYVDVDDTPGLNYGVSVGGDQIWPGAEGAQRMSVQYDLDWERFITMFVERVPRALP